MALAAIGSAGVAGLKAAQLSRRADLPLALALVVVLQIANLVAVPLWAGVVVPGGASLDRVAILRNLLTVVLLPLVVGIAVRVRSSGLAHRVRPGLLGLGNVALAVALAAGIVANGTALRFVLGSWVLATALAVSGVGPGLGLLAGLAGHADGPARISTSLVTGTRFSALGLVIVGSNSRTARSTWPRPSSSPWWIFVAMLAVAVGIGRRRSRPASMQGDLEDDHHQAEPAPHRRGDEQPEPGEAAAAAGQPAQDDQQRRREDQRGQDRGGPARSQ